MKEKLIELKEALASNQENDWLKESPNEAFTNLEVMVENILAMIPTDEDKRIEEAGHYLCDGDLSVAEQVALIDACEDDFEMIDDVDDGILVWEPVVYRYTVAEFQDLIS